MRRPTPLRFFAAALLFSLFAAPVARAALTLPDNPRIAFIGNTLVERDWQFGHLETLLINAFAEKDIVFRNLGWSGDTVRAESRQGFGQQPDGFNHLTRHVADLKPNVILLNYGLNESYAGPAGVEAFAANLAKLLDMLAAQGAPGAKVVIFSAMSQEVLNRPVGDPAKQNENIRLYNAALGKVAAERGQTVVDLFDVPAAYAAANPGKHFTDNGIHPTPDGHRFFAAEVARRLGLPAAKWDDRLERVRQLTIEKNQLYFHRWRPQNETYIFGFRKREQGRNAVEIPQFDPLIAEKEAAIAKAKKN